QNGTALSREVGVRYSGGTTCQRFGTMYNSAESSTVSAPATYFPRTDVMAGNSILGIRAPTSRDRAAQCEARHDEPEAAMVEAAPSDARLRVIQPRQEYLFPSRPDEMLGKEQAVVRPARSNR